MVYSINYKRKQTKNHHRTIRLPLYNTFRCTILPLVDPGKHRCTRRSMYSHLSISPRFVRILAPTGCNCVLNSGCARFRFVRQTAQHTKGEPRPCAQALEANPSRALTRAMTKPTARLGHTIHPHPAPVALAVGASQRQTVRSGRPEPAHRAPGAER